MQVLLDDFVKDLDITNLAQEDILQFLSGKWKNTQLPRPESLGAMNIVNPQNYDTIMYKNNKWINVPLSYPGIREDDLALAVLGL